MRQALTQNGANANPRIACAGMTNGKLFRRMAAGNSPGGIVAQSVQGMPPIFLSAGSQDAIFPVAQAGDAVRSLFRTEQAFLLQVFSAWGTPSLAVCVRDAAAQPPPMGLTMPQC